MCVKAVGCTTRTQCQHLITSRYTQQCSNEYSLFFAMYVCMWCKLCLASVCAGDRRDRVFLNQLCGMTSTGDIVSLFGWGGCRRYRRRGWRCAGALHFVTTNQCNNIYVNGRSDICCIASIKLVASAPQLDNRTFCCYADRTLYSRAEITTWQTI